MDETQNQTEPVSAAEETTQDETSSREPVVESGSEDNKKGTLWAYLIAAVVVLGILAAVFLQKGDQSLESPLGIDPDKTIATVNGEDIVGGDLATSVNQIMATAQLQGIDTTDPNVMAEIQDQAVEMLINTELLEQEADERGIVVTDADVTGRIDALIDEIGSQEALEERMMALGIDNDDLQRDVKSELMIQKLLDSIFAADPVSVSEEEIESLYQGSTGGGEGAPAIEEVRPQLEAQLRASKEQQVVDEFISSLREGAEIEVVE